ncbi:MAG: Dephospho-CoA kinase [uncultured Adhaeribacter sp.]|uniref:Dephospho-CoA kinase n=1 Tax=uncultured Adhaeribacter sp. TaxID=448109 RepID=A0A6J4GZT7_9BACT|nr:MAG: Dephospho-CoA kinase [uncultured Adhaeribacter sp.]
MLKVGVTGGIGTGKSIVCRVFALLGIPVYDSDARAKWVMHHHPELRQELIATFGAEVFDSSTNQLNRPYLARLAFTNPAQLTLLNQLVHPRVKQDFMDWVAAQQNIPYIIKEAALMYETEAHRQVTKMIAVTAPLPVRQARLLTRDPHRTLSDIQAIIEKQLPEEEKINRADYIIYNNDQQLVIPQIVATHQQLLAYIANQSSAAK